ncbi:MAG: hypothetical protein E6Q97_14380 [Desulfurellales bacterium]|nr:MAG: hypothetical protein E6Q97_14380 [Desulfurellales bacterium]
MSTVEAMRSVLEADATLVALATGGIFSFTETGRLGINRTNTPAAFDSNGIIKPCVLLRLRSSTPDYVLQDDSNQYQSVREAVELWFYEDSGYSAIETMRSRCYALLHATQVTGVFAIRWAGDIRNQIDFDLNASVERSDYQVTTKRSV